MTKYITQVHFQKGDITKVKLETGDVEPRATVVAAIEARQDYLTKPASPATGAKVHVVKHTSGKFISTDPNEKKSDNLGNLPGF